MSSFLYAIRSLFFLTATPLLLNSCGKSEPPTAAGPAPGRGVQAVEMMAVETMELSETVGLVGSIAANESAQLRPEQPGTLVEIGFEEGAIVKKGDVLAKLDTRELDAQLNETRAKFVLAESNLSRNQQLLTDGAVSRLEFDAAVAEHAQFKASIELLEVRLAKSIIIAPFDGIAGSRSLSVGDYLTPESVITTVDDLSRLKVEMDVPERYLPFLTKGGTFTLRTATSPDAEELTGEVYFVSSRIDESTRSTAVKGYLLSPPEFVKPGMFANISLVLRTVPKALVVPETAILSTARGTVLIVPKETEDGPVADFLPVLTGLRVPGYVQITPVGPPIKEGDLIVSSGVGGLILFPGVKLKPVEPLVKPGSPQKTDRNLD